MTTSVTEKKKRQTKQIHLIHTQEVMPGHIVGAMKIILFIAISNLYQTYSVDEREI